MSEAGTLRIIGTGFIREKSLWRESEKWSLEYQGIGKALIKLRFFRDPNDMSKLLQRTWVWCFWAESVPAAWLYSRSAWLGEVFLMTLISLANRELLFYFLCLFEEKGLPLPWGLWEEMAIEIALCRQMPRQILAGLSHLSRIPWGGMDFTDNYQCHRTIE